MQAWQERTALLVGEDGIERLATSTVVVVGVGGVGAYAAEMLVRAGVGHIVLIDSDTVSETNRNRQLIALESTLGKSKVDVLSARLKDINPALVVTAIQEYLTPENIPALLSPVFQDTESGVSADSVHPRTDAGGGAQTCLGGAEPEGRGSADTPNSVLELSDRKIFLIDAIDTLAPKLALINYCVKNSIPHVSSMGAGAKFDVTKIRIADISRSFNCPLAYIVRKRLRREYGISKGFKVVFSEELPDENAIIAEEGRNKKSNVGTISYLPAVFGCACAQAAVLFLIKNQ